ncbi:MAG: (Fe-S)-binding protein [Candidatus Aminicenantes bacterium]|nr:(Fe-S)-binding protein [Candidatus Aminicenantes bacterium]
MAEKSLAEIARLCADCGTCQSACPVYQAELSEPNSPRGKVNLIKAVADGRLEANRRNRSLLYQCLVCGACESACPNGVEFNSLMINYRNRISGGSRIPWLKKMILFLYQGFVLRRMLWLPRLLGRTRLKKKIFLPAFQDANLKKIQSRDRKKEYDILLFPGCVLTYFYAEKTTEIKALLENQGFSVAYPPKLQCCGFPYLSQGWNKKFAALKQKNLRIFAATNFKYLVVPCSTGVLAFKKYYDLPGKEIFELSEFLFKFRPNAAVDPDFTNQFNGAFTYHDPCHNIKSLKLQKEARRFLEQFGERYKDDGEPLCCGFGGIFKVGFPSTSKKILGKKAGRLAEIGASAVVTACPGCYMQLKESLPIPVYFFSEIFKK